MDPMTSSYILGALVVIALALILIAATLQRKNK